MARGFLDYLPQSVLDATSNNDFSSTVSSAMAGLADMAQPIMQPIGQQIASVMPAPEPMPMPQPEPPAVKPFSLGSMEDWGFGASKTPEAAPQMFSVGRPEDWGFGNRPQAAPTASAPTASASPSTAQSVPSGGPTEFNAYVRQSSLARGLDPDQVLKVVGKEGPTGWGSVGTFNTGSSFGPLQLHYGGGSNPKQGMGDDFTRDTGVDLRKVDPNTPEGIAAHQRAVDFALDRLSKTGDYREWYGAGPALGDRFTKVNRVPVQASPAEQAGSAAPPPGTYTKDNLQVNQISQGAAEGLSPAEALAICGPAASIAFSRAVGRAPTLKEAKELASRLGLWSVDQGMGGPQAQVKLLDAMGINAELQQGADEGAIAREIQAGRPVTIDTSGHYYVAQAYDPQTRTFDFGQSAAVLKASKGRTRYRLDELESLGMGAPRSTILLRGAK